MRFEIHVFAWLPYTRIDNPFWQLPDREPVTIAGVVTAVRARHEGAMFESDVFAIADGTLPAQVQEAAEITTTRVDPELYVPPSRPRPGVGSNGSQP